MEQGSEHRIGYERLLHDNGDTRRTALFDAGIIELIKDYEIRMVVTDAGMQRFAEALDNMKNLIAVESFPRRLISYVVNKIARDFSDIPWQAEVSEGETLLQKVADKFLFILDYHNAAPRARYRI